jgi:hypothetical protein
MFSPRTGRRPSWSLGRDDLDLPVCAAPQLGKRPPARRQLLRDAHPDVGRQQQQCDTGRPQPPPTWMRDRRLSGNAALVRRLRNM